jgi:hypothetical protein
MARIEILDYTTAIEYVSQFLPEAETPDDCEWIFLGDDYRKLKYLRKRFQDRLREKDIASEFHSATEDLRIPFVEYLSSYARDHPGFRLCSSFYERIPFQSHVFQNLCYLASATNAIEQSMAERILVICQDEAVALDLAQTLEDTSLHKIGIRTEGKFTIPLGWWRAGVKTLLDVIPYATFQAITLLLRHLSSSWIFWREDLPSKNIRDCILIHTWVAESTCSAKGYRELYCGDLQDRLMERGHTCILLPHLPPGKNLSLAPYLGCIRALKNSRRRFLPEELFLGLPEILSIWLRSILNYPRPGIHLIRNLSFGGCVYLQDLEDWMGLSICYPLAIHSLARGLRRREIHPDILVLLHENYSWEKAFIHGLRASFPSMRIHGYLHTTPSKYFLMHLLPESSPDFTYLPDLIITNGPRTSEFLLAGNYPRERVITGGALRYVSLTERASGYPPGDGEVPRTILVALPIDLDESVEILDKVSEALARSPGLVVSCKPHPFLALDRLFRAVDPEVFQRILLTQDPLDSLLAGTGVLVYSTSSSCMDALAMGVPVLKIVSERRLDIDPVGDCRGRTPYVRAARNPEEIASEVRNLAMRTFTPEERRQLAEIVAGIFARVTEETYAAFTRR